MITTIEIKLGGMHCQGCSTAIEAAIARMDGVSAIKADHRKGIINITFDSGKTTQAQLERVCTDLGYVLDISPDPRHNAPVGLLQAALAITCLVTVLILAQRFGYLLNLPVIHAHSGGIMVFIFGLLTGLHCVGMCGGFIIAYTAKDVLQSRGAFRSHVFYGVGKTLSYALLGGLFGFVGALFRVSPFISGLSIGLAGVFLVVYGLNMLNILSGVRTFCFRQPSIIMPSVTKKRRYASSPLFIGFLSGFILGCGPLQVMYVLAAGNGDPWTGFRLLTFFGLGTLPALFGFGVITRLLSNAMTRRFIQISGIIVMVMGAMMLNKGVARIMADEQHQPPCCLMPTGRP